MGHSSHFWDIFWASIYEKSLTECPVRDFCGEGRDLRSRCAPLHISVCPGAVSRDRRPVPGLLPFPDIRPRASSLPHAHKRQTPHNTVRRRSRLVALRGEDEIRTRGTELPVRRFSKPVVSATHPPLQFHAAEIPVGTANIRRKSIFTRI